MQRWNKDENGSLLAKPLQLVADRDICASTLNAKQSGIERQMQKAVGAQD